MELLTAQERARLLANGRFRRQAEGKNATLDVDFLPAGKLCTPDAECTCLLTELDPEDTDRAFGLCDLGLGSRNWGMSAFRSWSAFGANAAFQSSATTTSYRQ